MSFLAVKGLSKGYVHEGSPVFALKNLSFTLEKGDSLAVCGPSGAGKSTLLNIIGGLDRQSAGEVFLAGRAIHDLSEREQALFRQKELGFIFQFHHLLDDFTVLENVMMPLLIQGTDKKIARDRASSLLEQVGLGDFLQRLPRELSGGEQQRVAIARALVHTPSLVLADEPTGNLDEVSAGKVFELLCTLNHDLSSTLIVVTHQDLLAKKLKHCLKLRAGQMELYT